MTLNGFLNLAWQTVVAPQDVARLLMALKLRHEVLLLAFATVVVVNTVLVVLTNMAAPVASPLTAMLNTPVIVMVILAGTLAITAIALTWTGRALNGAARLEDMGLLVIWLQALWVIVRVGVLLLIPVNAALSAMLGFGASIVALYVLVNFVDAAHEFGSLFKAAVVLILGVTGMAVGLSVLFSLIGVTSMGLASYV